MTGLSFVGYPRGQFPGTTTNDNALAGNIGEYISAASRNLSDTVTISIASPAVVSWSGHGLTLGSPVTFSTTGALPTGITAGTQYWVIPVNGNTFQIATTPENAIAGTAVDTSGTQSGVQSASQAVSLVTGTPANLAFLNLTAGDWTVGATAQYTGDASTTVTRLQASISATSATISGIPGQDTDNGYSGFTLFSAAVPTLGIIPVRFSLATTTPIYLVGRANFLISTATGFGSINARRAR